MDSDSETENWYQFRDNNLLLNIQVPVEFEKHSKPEIIFVVDKSASMRQCNAIDQVAQSIHHMTSKKSITPTFIVYDELAYEISGEALARTLQASGCTCFEAAFKALKSTIRKKSFLPGSELHVVFMTDGMDNRSKNLKGAIQDFKNETRDRCLTTTIHTIGFRPQHNFQFLEEIRQACDSHGVYRYAGDFELENSFAELFDFLDESLSSTIKLGNKEIQVNGFLDDEKGTISFNAFVEVSNDLIPIAFTQNPILAEVMGHSVQLLSQPPNALFSIQVADSIDILCQDDVYHAQKILSEVDCFRCPKAIRKQSLEMRNAVQEKLNKYFSIFADAARKSVDPKSLTHQLNSMRYEAQFRKTRRQRTMDKRALANSGNELEIEEKLSKLSPNLSLYQGMDLVCPLSGDSISEIMEGSTSDFMVFALKVGRPEHVIEAPTNIEASKFLVGTYSFQAFQMTSKFAIDKEGAVAVHGGFSGEIPEEEMGLFKGPDGEYMNAALPLYINEDHFQRVKIQLKPILGYFFTLDPLGFKADQYLALYSILGHMHVQKAAGILSSDWADWLISDFTKLCSALRPIMMGYLQSGNYTSQVRGDPYLEFISSPKWRMKVYTQNLLTVVGWLEMLKSSDNNKIDEEMDRRYRVALTEECWRRACRNYYKQPHNNGRSVIILKSLIFGPISEDDDFDILSSPIHENVNKAKSKEFGEWARYKWGLLGKKTVVNMQHKYGGEEGPEVEGPFLEVEDFENGVKSPTIASYADHSDFFDSLFQSEMEKMSPTLAYLSQLYRSWISGEQFSGEEKRIILLQALMHRNRSNCEDSNESSYLNTFDYLYGDHSSEQQKIFAQASKNFEEKRKERIAAYCRDANDIIIAKRILVSKKMLSFCGRVMKSCPTRGGGVFDKVVSMLTTGKVDGKEIPLLVEKVSVLLTGKWKEGLSTHNVIAKGEPWVHCTCDVVGAFRNLIPEDEFLTIELQMHGRSGWVYRESDIPNRHGHCNSNPNPKLTCVFKGFKFQSSFKSKTNL